MGKSFVESIHTQLSDLNALSVAEIMLKAYRHHILIPAFNIAYLPMMEPIVQTLKEHDTFALVEVSQPDIDYFGAESYQAVAQSFKQYADRSFVRLHQDHVCVIDERKQEVAWQPRIQDALELDYDSVMLDGSRLPLSENIAATKKVVAMAHPTVAVEGELGAVLGHEQSPLPSYEEIFTEGYGYTDPTDVGRFVRETGVDWLSIAAGNIHGAVAGPAKDEDKIEARLDLDHICQLSECVEIPFVLHGGTGIDLECILQAATYGMTKINVGTAIRQPYEALLRQGGSEREAQLVVAEAVARCIEEYKLNGSASRLASSIGTGCAASISAKY
jgi:ketose-bisphosphate aldolase